MTDADALLAAASAVLLDFDGPCTRLFAGTDRPANLARVAAAVAPLVDAPPERALPDDVRASGDVMAVLDWAVRRSPRDVGLTALAEDVVTAIEVEHARAAEPEPTLAPFLRRCREAGLPVAVVTNNSPRAVQALAGRVPELRDLPAHGRTLEVLAELKPSPRLLLDALADLGVAPADAVMVGDTTTDVEAALAAGCRVVALALRPGRAQDLRAAGAHAVVASLDELLADRVRG